MAKAIYIQEGDSLDYPNKGAAVIDAGTIVVIGTKVGVAGTTIPVGEVGSVHMNGVFSIPKAAVDIAMGAVVYWDDTAKAATTTATNNMIIGYAAAAAVSADTIVKAKFVG